MKLPPDPDRMNEARSNWAAEALDAFQAETSTDDEDLLPDLLCDLMHWCDRNPTDFEAALARARSNYQGETT